MSLLEKESNVYFCYGTSKKETMDEDSWNIDDFLPATAARLYTEKSEALRAMGEIRKPGFKYGAIFRVELNEKPDEFDFFLNEMISIKKLTVLDAELYLKERNTIFPMDSYRFTEQGIRSLMKPESPLNEKIEQVLSQLSAAITFQDNSDKELAWRKVQDETYLLLADLLDHKKTAISLKSMGRGILPGRSLEQKIVELDIILKGLDLTKEVLLKPTEENVIQLKTFVEKEAPGKTNHWMRWGGALLAVVALAVFILSIIATAGGTVLAAGAIYPALVFGGVGASVSFFGQQSGLAKATSNIVEQSETELKPKGPSSDV